MPLLIPSYFILFLQGGSVFFTYAITSLPVSDLVLFVSDLEWIPVQRTTAAMFLGRKLGKRRQNSSEDLFFRNDQIFATEINFCSPKWVVNLPWVGMWATV